METNENAILREAVIRLRIQRDDLLTSLKAVIGRIENSELVRSTKNDSDPTWEQYDNDCTGSEECDHDCLRSEQVRSLNSTISELIAYRFALREATKELLVITEEMPAYAYDERGHEAYKRKIEVTDKVREVLSNTFITPSPSNGDKADGK